MKTVSFRWLCCGAALALMLTSPMGCADVQTVDPGGSGGSGGANGTECATDAECSASTPICAVEGVCRTCVSATECNAKNAAVPICADNGRCVECFDSNDCTEPNSPFCDEATLLCRACELHSECDSEVCEVGTGVCVAEASVVYASPSGSGSMCNRSFPCSFLPDAVDLVSSTKPYLRLLPGQYTRRLTIANKEATVVGEGATLNLTASSGIEPGVLITGSNDVVIDGLTVTNLSTGSGLVCDTSGHVTVHRSSFDRHDGDGINCANLTVTESNVSDNGERGIVASGDGVVIERNTIARNFGGGIGGAGLIRNNLILGNSDPGNYHGAIRVSGAGTTTISYNTIVGNFVNENFIGIIGCASDTIVSSNIIFGNEFPASGDDQTLIGCTDTKNNLSDVDIASTGTGNIIGDPMFSNAASGDYSLAEGSPAVDQGEIAAAPEVDFNGDTRPSGSGPDIGALESN